MRLGRRLSTGIAEDPPAPGSQPPQPVTGTERTGTEGSGTGRMGPEVRREYAEASER